MDLTKLVDTIDTLYQTDPTNAKKRTDQLLYEQLAEIIKAEKLQLLKDLRAGFKVLLYHHRSEINKQDTRQ